MVIPRHLFLTRQAAVARLGFIFAESWPLDPYWLIKEPQGILHTSFLVLMPEKWIYRFRSRFLTATRFPCLA